MLTSCYFCRFDIDSAQFRCTYCGYVHGTDENVPHSMWEDYQRQKAGFWTMRQAVMMVYVATLTYRGQNIIDSDLSYAEWLETHDLGRCVKALSIPRVVELLDLLRRMSDAGAKTNATRMPISREIIEIAKETGT